MTLNAVIDLILLFSPNSVDFQADYVTVVEDRPITSVKYCLPVPVFHFWPNNAPYSAVSAIAEHLVKFSKLTVHFHTFH